jgi:hypothetical protein
MSVRTRRVWTDAAKSASAVVILLAVLVIMDDRVQDELAAMFRGTGTSALSGAGGQLHDVGSALLYAAHTQSVEHAPLMIFVVTATVLMLWMLRT